MVIRKCCVCYAFSRLSPIGIFMTSYAEFGSHTKLSEFGVQPKRPNIPKPNMQIHNHVFRTFFIGLPCSSKICSVCTVSENLCLKICSMGLNLTRRIVHSQIVLKTKRKHEMEKTKIDNTHKSHRVAKFTENQIFFCFRQFFFCFLWVDFFYFCAIYDSAI